MLSPEQQAALGGYRPQDQALLQQQLQAIADRNRDRQQLGLPTRNAPVPQQDNFLLVALLGMLG